MKKTTKTLIAVLVVCLAAVAIYFIWFDSPRHTTEQAVPIVLTESYDTLSTLTQWVDGRGYIRHTQGLMLVNGLGHATDSGFFWDTIRSRTFYVMPDSVYLRIDPQRILNLQVVSGQ